MIIAMSVQTLYSLVDAIWVSGLDSDALVSLGFVFPLLFMGIAFATWLGIGGGSAIANIIGEVISFLWTKIYVNGLLKRPLSAG
jgi:Na+-driven multidrug efflux pump